ncbi:hypothetical protein ACP4OV_013634 [Aristida adscensionis]
MPGSTSLPRSASPPRLPPPGLPSRDPRRPPPRRLLRLVAPLHLADPSTSMPGSTSPPRSASPPRSTSLAPPPPPRRRPNPPHRPRPRTDAMVGYNLRTPLRDKEEGAGSEEYPLDDEGPGAEECPIDNKAANENEKRTNCE